MYARSAEDVPRMREEALGALKDRMWAEVWRDNVDLPQAVVDVRQEDSGCFRISVKL